MGKNPNNCFTDIYLNAFLLTPYWIKHNILEELELLQWSLCWEHGTVLPLATSGRVGSAGVMRVLEIDGKCWCTNPLLGTVRWKVRAEFGEGCQDFKSVGRWQCTNVPPYLKYVLQTLHQGLWFTVSGDFSPGWCYLLIFFSTLHFSTLPLQLGDFSPQNSPPALLPWTETIAELQLPSSELRELITFSKQVGKIPGRSDLLHCPIWTEIVRKSSLSQKKSHLQPVQVKGTENCPCVEPPSHAL